MTQSFPRPVRLTRAEIETHIDHVLAAPKDRGRVELIVRRPAVNAREVITEGKIDREHGLLGDNWLTRGSSRTDNGLGHPEMQLNVMNYRFAELIAGSRERVPLAGDQLYIDLDLSSANLPPGTRIKVGDAVIEVTAIPHTGCKKFVERFGLDAMKVANSEFGRRHNLRGINAKVVEPGKVRAGDTVSVISRPALFG
ncbi:MAG TPA: MOSC domain-containing protein [Blastocatellia bacterium]|nr:MOSC domain-containing protein [Blastocatellia bacterium]